MTPARTGPRPPAAAHVLVAYASRTGATAEIAERIAAELRADGHRVTVLPCSEVESVDQFDAVIVGSAIYFRQWMSAAGQFLRRHRRELAVRPVWLFQSGPCAAGDDPAYDTDLPSAVRRLAAQVAAGRHATFGGRLDAAHADGPLARWMAHTRLAGDYRDWDRVCGWARAVSRVITEHAEAARER